MIQEAETQIIMFKWTVYVTARVLHVRKQKIDNRQGLLKSKITFALLEFL